MFQIGTQNDLSSINERDLSRLLESNNIQSSSLIDLIMHIMHRSSNDSDFEEKQKVVSSCPFIMSVFNREFKIVDLLESNKPACR